LASVIATNIAGFAVGYVRGRVTNGEQLMGIVLIYATVLVITGIIRRSELR
jgi:hypothetical protein